MQTTSVLKLLQELHFKEAIQQWQERTELLAAASHGLPDSREIMLTTPALIFIHPTIIVLQQELISFLFIRSTVLKIILMVLEWNILSTKGPPGMCSAPPGARGIILLTTAV